MTIPLYKTAIGSEEEEVALAVLQSGALSRGEQVHHFEEEFARFVNKKYAVAVSSGTSALHLAVRGAGWKPGDEVITTPFSYIASANCLRYEGVTPVFADIDPLTGTIDPRDCEQKITERTRGILLVHILGQSTNPILFSRLKRHYRLAIVEDACQALGTPSESFSVGQVGEATVYSFFENKPITSGGEGGMIVTDNSDLAQKYRSWRDQGRSSRHDWLNHVTMGYNYRMTEIQAAIGRVQLKKLPTILAQRTNIAQTYTRHLKDTPDILLPSSVRSWFVYPLLFTNTLLRDMVHEALKQRGIESRCGYFPPLYSFPMYRTSDNVPEKFPLTELLYNSLLVIPVHQTLTETQIEQICNTIKATIARHKEVTIHASVC